MTSDNRPPVILIAEDDPDDQLMLQDAFEESCEHCQLRFVSDGVELMGCCLVKKAPGRCRTCCCST